MQIVNMLKSVRDSFMQMN